MPSRPKIGDLCYCAGTNELLTWTENGWMVIFSAADEKGEEPKYFVQIKIPNGQWENTRAYLTLEKAESDLKELYPDFAAVGFARIIQTNGTIVKTFNSSEISKTLWDHLQNG